MSCGTSAVKFQFRRDTQTAWTTNNPILTAGEPGVETDTRRLKVGDGVTRWNLLPYIGQTSSSSIGNTAVVDTIYGNDSVATVGGSPFKTIAAAVAAVVSGQTVWILPGTYTLTSGITLPNGISIRGLSLQTVVIQMIATSNASMITMGENCRVEDITLNLTSSTNGLTLNGIVFAGTSSQTSKLRTCVLTVDDSAITTTSTVNGALFSGTGSLNSSTFSFNSIKGSTINVRSNGTGNKRGILVSNSNQVSTRDVNILVAQPRVTSSTGSYVGVETNDSGNTGSIQLRSTTVGVVLPTGVQAYTASDILQTTPATILDPTYLATAGIQIGPGTDLITKSAGGRGFSTYNYPTTIYYGLQGDIKDGRGLAGSSHPIAYLWPGTQYIANNTFPDITVPVAYYRMQQPAILSGLSVGLATAPGTGKYVTILIKYTPDGGTLTNSVFTVTLSNAQTSSSFYNGSLRLGAGDKVHVSITYSDNTTTAHDLTVQVDIF